METRKELDEDKRYILLAIAWGLALFATAPNPFFLLMFPLGLVQLFTSDANKSPASLIVAIWVAYISLSLFTVMQKRPARYFCAYGILVILLGLNTVGCHVMMAKPFPVSDAGL